MEDDSFILDQLDLGEINTWSEEQQQAARKLLCDYSETFSKNGFRFGQMQYPETHHSINRPATI